jgi:intron-binding protein aquarius
VVLIGDHHQLPPVVQHPAFQKFAHLDQSMFARFVRLGVPCIQLNKQGRARSEIADLYSWRLTKTFLVSNSLISCCCYRYSHSNGEGLGNLPLVEPTSDHSDYSSANAGLAHTFQLINVPGSIYYLFYPTQLTLSV